MVMVPFVAHGHLNQLVHLSRLISTYKIPVHFVTTTTHIRQVRSRFQDFSSHSAASNLIHFHEFRTPPFTSPQPNPSNRFPAHLQPAIDSSLHLRRPVTELIRSLSSTTKRVVVVHDSLMLYVVQNVKSIPNAVTYIFDPVSAFDTFWGAWERRSRPFPVDPGMLKRLPSSDGCFSPEFIDFVNLQIIAQDGSHVGELFDSSRVIEGEYLEYLEREQINGKKKFWAIGPLINHVDVDKSTFKVSNNRHKCLQWLDMLSQL